MSISVLIWDLTAKADHTAIPEIVSGYCTSRGAQIV
jgi:hypothetical protein